MFSKFSEEAQKSLLLAREEMIKLRHPYIGSEHLFWPYFQIKIYLLLKCFQNMILIMRISIMK